MSHALLKNRCGLIMALMVTQAAGTVERQETLAPLDQVQGRGLKPRALGADKGYQSGGAFYRSLKG